MEKVKKRNGVNVVFVEPMGANANVFDKFMSIPMLGPLYLATIADEAGYNSSILNENILRRRITEEELKDVDILCMSCMTATIERGKEIARIYKKIRETLKKESWTIIGGIHASMIPEDVVDDFDQVFVGEAEEKILDILSGKTRTRIVYGDRIKDLDATPIPNFRLLKNWESMRSWPVMTSRGCPYDCTFCSVTAMFGQSYRVKSVDRVIEELKSYDHKWFFFVDDHFIIKKKRAHELLEAFQREKLNLRWSCQVRTELGKDPALVKKMRAVGCRTVYVGFESINQKSLDEMNKRQTLTDIENSIRVFRKSDINIHGMFMFGSDSDDKDIFKNTSDFCRKSGITTVQYMIMTPLPGTVLYKKLEREGRLLHKKWEYFDAMHVVFQPRNFSTVELQKGMIDCYSDFYSYTNAFNDALNLFFDTFVALGKRLYGQAYLPSLIPALMKIVGKQIVKNWIENNKPYLAYLKIMNRPIER
jgi:radical SAM superfamily enzyme YgiQ (UPF0313 family)